MAEATPAAAFCKSRFSSRIRAAAATKLYYLSITSGIDLLPFSVTTESNRQGLLLMPGRIHYSDIMFHLSRPANQGFGCTAAAAARHGGLNFAFVLLPMSALVNALLQPPRAIKKLTV